MDIVVSFASRLQPHPQRSRICPKATTAGSFRDEEETVGRKNPTTVLSLLQAKRISLEGATRLYHADSIDAISAVAETLYKSGQITASERNDLICSVEREKQSQSKRSIRAKLREAERFVGGGKRSPVAQGGLPSLGKKR